MNIVITVLREILREIYISENGQSLAEYALILMLVTIAVVFSVSSLGDSVVGLLNRVVSIWPT
ncbi:hypothetical protein DealDRAFT_0816 [Dethiobacter alkaliphilus AHT 1]|uniref:Flp/Fap pilin component n=1 Tax=Dethiobacter alkaliphilus AHT 1 TaxID=555088 RepID=C0GEA7_DETAL|nr:hypothetical protein DealDRAFT_0816 [Dethiobacter alkaliphilus AHT 1]